MSADHAIIAGDAPALRSPGLVGAADSRRSGADAQRCDDRGAGAAIDARTGFAGVHRDSLAPTQKRVFDVLRPAALALVASDYPVSMQEWFRGEIVRWIGHNRGVWPARVARTGSWSDTVSGSYDRNPFIRFSVQFRLWSPTAMERDRLADAAIELITARAEADGGVLDLRHDYQDLGPDLDLALFEAELAAIASRLGVRVMDDAECVRWLDAVHAEAGRLSRTGEITARLIEIAASRLAHRRNGR